MKSPFPAGWWSFDLRKYRRCDGTYALYAYESVPPLDESQFTGVFRNYMTAAGKPRPDRTLARLVKAAQRVGVALPAAFRTFMGDVSLQDEVPSCTACEWDLSAAPVPCKVVPGAFTVRFLRDQQDCLFWYLHVLPDGDAHVLCSPIPFDEPAVVDSITPEVVIANTWYCAPHFEHFVFRFWIENVLWGLLGRPEAVLTAAQRAYVSHYGAPPKVAAGSVGDDEPAEKAATKKAGAGTGAKKAAAKQTAATKKAAAKQTAATKKDTKKTTAKRAGAKEAAAKQTAATKKDAKKAGAGKGSKKTTARRGVTAVAKNRTRRGATMKAARRATRRRTVRVLP